jgi:Tfp pilus assembly protein PilV
MAPARPPAPRGVSLIEAVVALAVMASGLLGIVGIQTTLRANSDVAKQRSEGVRLAQEKIEELRLFANILPVPGGPSYDAIAAATDVIAPSAGRPINTTYTRTTTVTPMDGRGGVGVLETLPRAKSISVNVSWQDRAGQTQSVTLHTAISGIAPALAGTLAVPPDGGVLRQPFGRSREIPVAAVDLGDGRSAFLPPGGTPGVTWVFDNVTALIRLCTLTVVTGGRSDLTASNIVCGNSYARLLAGFLRYSLTGVQPGSVQALNPPSSRPVDLATLTMVVDQSIPFPATQPCVVNQAATPGTFTPFLCAVPVAAPTIAVPYPAWSGSLRAVVTPDSFAAGFAGGAAYRLCRYRLQASYSNVGTSLLNQNFLVIEQAFSCPLPPPNPLPNPVPDPQPVWTITHQPP